MTTAAAGKRKALRRRRPKANIAGGPKTQANAGIASMLRDGSSWTAIQDEQFVSAPCDASAAHLAILAIVARLHPKARARGIEF